jgi:hypothetical protein
MPSHFPQGSVPKYTTDSSFELGYFYTVKSASGFNRPKVSIFLTPVDRYLSTGIFVSEDSEQE